MFNYLEPTYIKNFIQNALTEDVGDGDHTSLSTVPHDAIGRARLLVKDKGILAGVELAKMIFAEVDPELQVTTILEDGTAIDRGQIVLTVEGRSQSILKAERLVLNCMQRMSGIATYTRSMVNLIEGTNTKLLDTRKTTPNFRLCEKWACKIGGAVNHRYALFDMILIKDNHVDYAGGIANAIRQANEYLVQTGKNLQIEIEVRNLDELQQVLAIGQVNRIMLDNFSFENLREAVRLIDGKYLTEASGGINETTIRQYAECGVDYISSGALTHQIKSLDLSLKAY
ncbi:MULTISPECIES: carboxylating nicotinate-nucleotide diphosphorylase [Flectobacillus]|uniref:nicotinate-nucleotide diphosphorylase (carboxylating) n=1 Tax=Flectobacillus roseus TaxID=502259 RepID=A0ABT6YD95_9BACT|nr:MULTISPECIES: carboxylating nicotinate-nucleotide diphosphorylase [Flectobacillus]MDI9861556.1 carboxylating nicotinate-nucleotide diphosphorylase [Flectobacillus roseus]PAC32188.1 nicotinate-nucleotide diphosphorylase (carboxylating) [Flectobacillus sp. BAB-3569]